ncbi:MAG TPA: ATP-binding protein, partial [Polyangiaceae bacterium]|nr:ATP-binding protein [Polyangiaceae bacterium]
VRKDGSHIDVSVTVSPIRSDDGRVVGASAIGRDITERKRAEKRLAEADRQKDQFLAMLGHELRNPLAAVRNATELLKLQTNTDATTERIREILDRQTRHMAHLMDGLLDVSRILRNKIDLKFEPVDMAAIVRDVVDEYQARPERSPPRIQLTVETGSTWVRGDSVRLTQIIDNLLGNAVKFTGRDGAIFLTLIERNDQVIFSVRDTGRGITTELLPHVFDVFRQAQQSLDRTSGGLGLGLALVKLLTELHGGSVEALSEGPERGAEFIVRVPAIPVPPKARTPLPAAAGKTFDILVVEDNRDAAELLCELLQLAGHATELAFSAEAAWERLQQRTPEVVLCDLGLPGAMTGFDLARRIRSDERFLRTRVIAVSGYGRPEDKVASRQAGFDAHLTKPVDFDALQSVLTQSAS